MVRDDLTAGASTPALPVLKWPAGVSILAMAATLSACGGGGGGSVSSTPPPPTASAPAPTPPAPAPTPTPSPTPTSASVNWDTAEFRRSDGPGFHNAVSAYRAGASGEGVTIGIIDSGIDADSPEFAGRIHAQSADLAGARGIDDEGGHGTAVAQVAAAARDGVGVMGIAFRSDLLVLRADTPGSCTGSIDQGCSYANHAIAAGLDRAVAAGARVVNISLGGATPPAPLTEAVRRATAAGVVVVVSAGNRELGGNASGPDPLAMGLQAAGNGMVIIAASVDDNGQISDFSNRAGSFAGATLSALGERVCCTYENGQMRTENGYVYVFSGTSFAAPQIAGAVALLAQAFPNLSGAQIVELLLSTARDAGATGTDEVYGRGILDIAAALRPQGATSLAGTTTALPLATAMGTASGAMGDAPQGSAGVNAVILDRFDRAFTVDLGRSLQSRGIERRLGPVLAGRTRSAQAGSGATAIAFTIAPTPDGGDVLHPLRIGAADAERARLVAASVVSAVGPVTRIAFGFNRSADSLAAGLQGAERPAFLVAEDSWAGIGQIRDIGNSAAVRQRLGGFGVTIAREQGDIRDDTLLRAGQGDPDRYHLTSMAFDRAWPGLHATLGLTLLDEMDTVLGARFNPLFGGGGASTAFADAGLRFDLGQGWLAGASWRQGWTSVRAGGITTGAGTIRSSAFTFDIGRTCLLGPGDRLFFRVAQPLRVSEGSIGFELPIAYDYASRTATFGEQRQNLAPRGRELVGELAYGAWLGDGHLSANLFYRREPGHFEATPEDMGVAVRYQLGF